MKPLWARLAPLCLWTLLTAMVPDVLLASEASSGPLGYPASAGVLDVRTFGAAGDGITDDTAAIQRALSAGLDGHTIVYLPPGIYRVHDTLRWKRADDHGPSHGWGRFLQLRGAGRGRSIIRLGPSCPGFGDGARPRAVIQTGSSAYDGRKEYFHGEGNEAFENDLRDFSVEVGPGNAGAIGISFQASNSGAIRSVAITAAAGSGAVGIDLSRRDNGPGLISDVDIDGFAVGVLASQEICQFTIDHLRLLRQRQVGIHDHDAVLAVHHLDSRNTVPAVVVSGDALCCLITADLEGGAPGGAAVIFTGPSARGILRSLSSRGYGRCINDRGKPIPGGSVAWWVSDGILDSFPAKEPPPAMRVREEPLPTLPPVTAWTDVGEANGHDDSDAITAAFRSGGPAVFFRHGTYHISRELTVPAHVHWIIGLGTSLDISGGQPLADNKPMLRFAQGSGGDVTVVDAFWIGTRKGLFTRHVDQRTLILRDLIFNDSRVYENARGSGPLFVDDCAGAGYRFAGGSTVFARQWNIEGPDTHVICEGSSVWALGFKTEGGASVLDATGSDVEMYGGLLYTFGTDRRPAFSLKDCRALLSFAGTTYVPDGYFKILVHEQQGAVGKDLGRDLAPGRGGGRTVTAYLAQDPGSARTRISSPGH